MGSKVIGLLKAVPHCHSLSSSWGRGAEATVLRGQRGNLRAWGRMEAEGSGFRGCQGPQCGGQMGQRRVSATQRSTQRAGSPAGGSTGCKSPGQRRVRGAGSQEGAEPGREFP